MQEVIPVGTEGTKLLQNLIDQLGGLNMLCFFYLSQIFFLDHLIANTQLEIRRQESMGVALSGNLFLGQE
jgi:hypothetical protein